MPRKHHGLIGTVFHKWHRRKKMITSSPDLEHIIKKRIAQRELLKDIDLPADRRREAIAVTKHSVRLNEAAKGAISHTLLSRQRALYLLKENRRELVRIIRRIHTDETAHGLEQECAQLGKEIRDRIEAIEKGSQTSLKLDAPFLGRVHRVYDRYLKMVLGEAQYAVYHHRLKTLSRLAQNGH